MFFMAKAGGETARYPGALGRYDNQSEYGCHHRHEYCCGAVFLATFSGPHGNLVTQSRRGYVVPAYQFRPYVFHEISSVRRLSEPGLPCLAARRIETMAHRSGGERSLLGAGIAGGPTKFHSSRRSVKSRESSFLSHDGNYWHVAAVEVAGKFVATGDSCTMVYRCPMGMEGPNPGRGTIKG